jgi:hypothetical protein
MSKHMAYIAQLKESVYKNTVWDEVESQELFE